MVLEGLLSDMKANFKKNEHKTSYIIALLFPNTSTTMATSGCLQGQWEWVQYTLP